MGCQEFQFGKWVICRTHDVFMKFYGRIIFVQLQIPNHPHLSHHPTFPQSYPTEAFQHQPWVKTQKDTMCQLCQHDSCNLWTHENPMISSGTRNGGGFTTTWQWVKPHQPKPTKVRATLTTCATCCPDAMAANNETKSQKKGASPWMVNKY